MVRPVRLHLISQHRFRGGTAQHLRARISRRYSSNKCCTDSTIFEAFKTCTAAVRTAVRTGFLQHEFPELVLFCTAGFWHRNREKWTAEYFSRLLVEISCICIIKFLSCKFAEEIIKSLLSDWFSPWGFFQGWLAKNFWVKFYGVHAFIFSLLVLFCVFNLFRKIFYK